MQRTADITLIEQSTAGNPDRVFRAQRVVIEREPRSRRVSADGIVSFASHPTTITWLDGTVALLADTTNVRMTENGRIIVDDAQINTNHTVPTDFPGGVRFAVFEGDGPLPE